jgi:Icc-related predicted phosphoesterase
MRVLLASDLHYRLRQFDWLVGVAGNFDAVVLAGDHLDAALPVPCEVQVAALSATLARLAQRTRLVLCSGNHDLDARSPAGEKTAGWLAPLRRHGLLVDGDTACVADTLFTACPWWDGPAARADLEALLAGAAARRAPGQRWVWAYHAPPEGPLSWTGKRHFGDPALPALIARHAPDAVLCGHVHEAPFRAGGSWAERVGRTWLFNAGGQIGDVPARVEIDFGRGEAQWHSLAGQERRALGLQ